MAAEPPDDGALRWQEQEPCTMTFWMRPRSGAPQASFKTWKAPEIHLDDGRILILEYR